MVKSKLFRNFEVLLGLLPNDFEEVEEIIVFALNIEVKEGGLGEGRYLGLGMIEKSELAREPDEENSKGGDEKEKDLLLSKVVEEGEDVVSNSH